MFSASPEDLLLSSYSYNGFRVIRIATLDGNPRWGVVCGEQCEPIVIPYTMLLEYDQFFVIQEIGKKIREAMDRMWSRWLAL